MKNKKNKISRKEFIKTSSLGVLGTAMIAGAPVGILAGTPAGVMAGSAGMRDQGASQDIKKLPIGKLGNTGISMTRLGVGAPRIQEAVVLRYALDQGVTFIDTGRRYFNGKNEEMVGEAIKGRRKDFVIQSKVPYSADFGKEKLSAETIASRLREEFNKSLEESLKALKTDYIDIMLFHDAGDNEFLYHEAVLESFAKAKQEGKILATGFSFHSNLIGQLKKHNEDPFYDVLMLCFNPHGGFRRNSRDTVWDQEAVINELSIASASGTGVIAMKTCLGGPYQGKGETEATYPGAVKWVFEQPFIHAAVVAMANFQQVDEHLAVHLV